MEPPETFIQTIEWSMMDKKVKPQSKCLVWNFINFLRISEIFPTLNAFTVFDQVSER